MSKSFDEWNQQMESMEVPTEKLNKTINDALDKAEADIKKKKLKANVQYVAASVAIIGCLVFGGAYASPTFANALSNVPVIGSIFEQLGDKGLQQAREDGYVQQGNESISKDEVSFTVKETVYDNARISISMIEETKNVFPEISYIEVFKDGELFQGDYQFFEEKISENQHALVMNLYPERVFDHAFDLQLKIHAKNTNTTWDLEVPVVKITETTNYEVIAETSVGDRFIMVTELKEFPTGTQIKFKTNVKADEYLFSDEDGNILENISLEGVQENGTISYTGLYEVIQEGTEVLHLTLYNIPKLTKAELGVVKAPFTNQLPIILKQGEQGKAIIDDVQKSSNKVSIRYRTVGEFNFLHSYVRLMNKKGEECKLLSLESIKRTINESEYVAIFRVDKTEDLDIFSLNYKKPEVINEMQLQIDLNK